MQSSLKLRVNRRDAEEANAGMIDEDLDQRPSDAIGESGLAINPRIGNEYEMRRNANEPSLMASEIHARD